MADVEATVDGGAVVRRTMWRIMPLLTAFYLVAVIDRSNVAFAKLQMVRGLHMTEASYGLASSMFFIGYLLFEVPSAYAAHRAGARLWFVRILGSWGVCTIVLAWSQSGTMFTGLRFLLGVLEAGAYPGIIYCLTLWFPQRDRVRMLGLMTLGSALGNGLGAIVAGPVLELNGALGLAGWQWVFLVTGIPALVVTALLLAFLPDRPAQARFLTAAERDWLGRTLAAEAPPLASRDGAWNVLLGRQVWQFSVSYTMMTVSLYGIIYWLPTVIRSFGATAAETGGLTALPWLLDAAILLVLPGRVRGHHDALKAMVAIAVVGVIALVASTWVADNAARYAALLVGAPCISLLFPCFWSLPQRHFAGPRAAIALAMISSIGTLGGFFAQNLMPWVAHVARSPVAAMIVPAFCLALVGIGALVVLMRPDDRGLVRSAT